MSVEPVSVQKYRCSVCKAEYDDLRRAEVCSGKGEVPVPQDATFCMVHDRLFFSLSAHGHGHGLRLEGVVVKDGIRTGDVQTVFLPEGVEPVPDEALQDCVRMLRKAKPRVLWHVYEAKGVHVLFQTWLADRASAVAEFRKKESARERAFWRACTAWMKASRGAPFPDVVEGIDPDAAEAEQLRSLVEETLRRLDVLQQGRARQFLQNGLDRIDAGDSLAWIEEREKLLQENARLSTALEAAMAALAVIGKTP